MPFKQPLEELRWRCALKAADFKLGPVAPPRGSSRPLPLAAWMLGLGLIVVGTLAFNYYQEQGVGERSLCLDGVGRGDEFRSAVSSLCVDTCSETVKATNATGTRL